jgi:hypothetical protein
MTYQELLASINRTAEEMGTKVNSLIRAYLKHQGNIAKATAQRDEAKTQAKKDKISKEIEIAEAQLIDMNNTICEAITKYNASFDLNKKKGKQLGAKTPSAADPVIPGARGNGGVPSGEPEPPAKTEPSEPGGTADPKDPPKKKEGSGGLLLFLGLVAAGIAAAVFGTRSK